MESNYIEEIDWYLKCLNEDYENLKKACDSFYKEEHTTINTLCSLRFIQIALLCVRLKCDYIICEASEALKNNQ